MECAKCQKHPYDCKCGRWICGKTYPNETGSYLAIFPSGRSLKATYTSLCTNKFGRIPYGRWGEGKIGEDYVPLKDPIVWENKKEKEGKK